MIANIWMTHNFRSCTNGERVKKELHLNRTWYTQMLLCLYESQQWAHKSLHGNALLRSNRVKGSLQHMPWFPLTATIHRTTPPPFSLPSPLAQGQREVMYQMAIILALISIFPELGLCQIKNPSLPFHWLIRQQIQKGRYLGPFSTTDIKNIIGPFQSFPFSIIPKPGRPGLFCLLQNFSYPHEVSRFYSSPSINSVIYSHNFPCSWGTFNIICLLIICLPLNSQAATRDDRGIPLHPSQDTSAAPDLHWLIPKLLMHP